MASCHDWLASLKAPNGVLKSFQCNGRAYLENYGIPNKKIEEWRLTDIKKLENILRMPILKDKNIYSDDENNKLPVKPEQGVRITLNPENNYYQNLNLPKGVTILSMLEIKQYLGKTVDLFSRTDYWPIAVNHAANEHLLALKIDGQNIPPLELLIKPYKKIMHPTRVLLIVGKNTKLDLLQVSLGAKECAINHLIEIHVGKGAKVKHGWLALGNENSNCFANLLVEQDKNSHYALSSVQNGWDYARFEPRVIQLEGNAKTTIKGLQISTRKEQIATHSEVKFNGPSGVLEQINKIIATGQSHSIFNGEIKVPAIAQETNASQLSRNLLISKRARIDTKPELEIIADNVSCSHGATISQLQEEELFYLQSRGIDALHATYLLLNGFCQELIESLPVNATRWNTLNHILNYIKE